MSAGTLGKRAGAAETRDVTRHFVTVDDGVVHYRRAGQGPAVVMLHDSPRSSRLHVDTMRALADRFTLVALDTPGYGNSTPLPVESPMIGDFAKALGKVLDVLGLAQAPLYATHTSAKIALEYAASSAAPPPLLLLDGLSIPTRPADESFIARYMRPFRPDPAGAYIAAEWTRMRDMLRWFPWFDARPQSRVAMPPPDDAWMEAYAIDLFSAGPHYSDAYAAAMRYDPRAALRAVRCPTIVAARSTDVLYPCLDLLPDDRSDSVTVRRLGADHGQWLDWLAMAFGAAGGAAVDPPWAAPAFSGPVYVDLPHGQMLVHRRGQGSARPLLILETPTLLHARAWQDALAGRRPTLVPELPGYGESDPLGANDLAGHADALAGMLDRLRIGEVDLLSIGLASPLALAFAARHADRIAMLAFDGLAPAGGLDADRLCPEFRHDGAGAHLHRIWHMLRDAEAQWPWHDGGVAAQRVLAPMLDAPALHAALVDIMKQPRTYGDAARACLGSVAVAPHGGRAGTLLFDHPHDPAYAGARSLAAVLPEARLLDRPADIAAAAELLDRALSSEPEIRR